MTPTISESAENRLRYSYPHFYGGSGILQRYLQPFLRNRVNMVLNGTSPENRVIPTLVDFGRTARSMDIQLCQKGYPGTQKTMVSSEFVHHK